MSLKINIKDAERFIGKQAIYGLQDDVQKIHRMIKEKTGAGSDFLGWLDLPISYNKE